MAFDSKKFLVRTGSAAIFVIVLLGCILWNYYSFSALFFIVSLWGLHEFYKLMEVNGNKPIKWLGFIAGVVGYLYISFRSLREILYSIEMYQFNIFIYWFGSILLIFLCGLVLLSPIIELFRNKEKPLENVAITLYGVLYVVVPFAILNYISCWPYRTGYFETIENPYKPTLIISIFLLIWSNDTFAYLVGSFIGKNKMYERISPGKTWEGTIGGAILTVASSFLIYKWFGILELHDWIIISAIVAVFGTLGDLVESMLKRSVGVKDSGNIMPGHGGILDRFDSLIMVAPFVFLYLILK
jgi:phosphatidate cytidylyltransferase